MKNSIIIVIVVALFLALSVFSCTKIRQVIKLTKEKTELQSEFNQLNKEKDVIKTENVTLKSNLMLLEAEKTSLSQKLIEYTTETDKLILSLKDKIREANSLPADTVYLTLFSKWEHFNQVLKYRFAEAQIRGIYLNVLERDNYERLYASTTKSLVTCTDLNSKNDKIIGNLTTQNTNLTKINDLSELQIVNLEDNLKLSDNTLNKQKRKTFFYKVTTVVGATGCFILMLK